ncbi:tumor necrosis factor receptor superfamily member 21-like isoform X2 [Branchiostoma lanceolatum]|uniref:tumor necrosis factor receptor superfamily member 21-like isoform X2 n=1 Tax=Branchiostoma lanceolatum TaxID=7740 RepID=UPI00345558C7
MRAKSRSGHNRRSLLSWTQYQGIKLPLLVRCDSHEAPPKWEYYNPLSGETLLCDWCAPGEYMVTECTQTTVTQCHACAENEYTEHYNHVRECFRCRECLKPHEHVLLGCTPTNNRQCVCEDGFFLAVEFCFQHTKCPIRYGVVQRGTPWKNTKCRRCRSGTFSDVDSSVATCRNHTDCGTMGLCVTRRGNRGVDNVCGICPDYNTTAPNSEDETTVSTARSTEFVSAPRQEDNGTREHVVVTVVRWEPIVYVTIAIVILAAIIVAFCCVVKTLRRRRADTAQRLPPLQTTLAGKTPIVSFIGNPKGKESPPTESDQAGQLFETHHTHADTAAAARQTTSARRTPLAMTRLGTPTVPRLRRTKSRPNDDEQRRRPTTLKDAEVIVDDIGGAWRHLGRELGFTDGRLDGFQSDYHLQLREAVFQMLRTWIEERRGDVTLGKLMDALNNVGKPELAEALLDQTS